MNLAVSSPKETLWQENFFRFIKPEEFKSLAIDPSDIPLGTFPALKHPSHLLSRFGGNAYGFGLFEIYDRLKQNDIKLLQTIVFENPEDIKDHYKDINKIYKKIGLLTRFSGQGNLYYLIPIHLLSNTLIHTKVKADEISKIISFHRKKYSKEDYSIGLVTDQDNLIINELSFRFKEHHIVVLDSLDKLQNLKQTLDLIILTKDLYQIVLMDDFDLLSQETLSKKRLNQYSVYILWMLYNLLKPEGELFIIADHYTAKTNRTTELIFKTIQEEKNFALFTHLFKTKKKYKTENQTLQVNVFDFQKYLSDFYVEQEIIDTLLEGKKLEEMSLDQINNLPYLNYQLTDLPFLYDQKKAWSSLFPIFFDNLFFKPLFPKPVKKEWESKFSYTDYIPNYMLIYLGQKKPLKTKISEVKKDVLQSKLAGCSTDILPDHKDSFEYVIRTLHMLDKLRKGSFNTLPQIFVDRLKQPFENKNRRFHALNDVIKLISKIKQLEKVKDYLNPDGIQGTRTKVLKNLEALAFFDFNYNELKEILFIVLGHTPLGQIIFGKINEKLLKPVSDLARTCEPKTALNLLRYYLIMTTAETAANRGTRLTQEHLKQLFDFYESTIRVITNPDLDWDELLDEKLSSTGGIHNNIIRKLLMMINHLEFLDNWFDLRQKGQMEKESLADYDDHQLLRVENVIRLVNTVDEFKERFLQSNPLQLSIFYRKFVDIEFHGTLHIFERMDSRLVFILLWITINIARGKIINFNPILADVETAGIKNRVRSVEQETKSINIHYLDLAILEDFSIQLYKNNSAFIMGTGFQLKVDPKTQALEIGYLDINKDIKSLEALSKKIAGRNISKIPVEDLKVIEILFSNLDGFCQNHLRILKQMDPASKMPVKQKLLFNSAQNLLAYLRSNFLEMIFHPEEVYNDLNLLFSHTPSLLNFILPEFSTLQDLDFSWHLYLKSPVTHYLITATRKIQALVRQDKESFQDTGYLHRLAQKEFGPMATGIVGTSETQIVDLENIIVRLRLNQYLFDALIKSFIFQDLGRVPALKEKYKNDINPADLGQAGALFLERGKIAERYHLKKKSKPYLIFLVKHHSLLHHIVRGEFSLSSIQDVLDFNDKDLYDAFFVLSFIMLSSIREDLMLEDLANRLFRIRTLCLKIINTETTLKRELIKTFSQMGDLFYALENYQINGLPEEITASEYLESLNLEEIDKSRSILAGKMIFAMERIFRLRGIRYVGFHDLVELMLNVPIKFIYKKRNFLSIGYATFEKEVYEAFNIYKTLQSLTESIRHFILNRLDDDKIRIFGYENTCDYLNYDNQVKLLLISLLGAQKIKSNGKPVCLNFLEMSKNIEKRYEAVNDALNTLSAEKLFGDRHQINHFFKAKTGLILKKENFPDVISINFKSRVNISKKLSYMDTINNIDQLKDYFHNSLRSLRNSPFNTDDYELQLEKSFEKRLTKITDIILNETKEQMDLIKDFRDLYILISDLLEQTLDIGFSDEQMYRLNDLYELRKDTLKREKLFEIDGMLDTIRNINELSDYWSNIKLYLQNNRRFFGKTFENLVAKRFDCIKDNISSRTR